MLQKNRFILFFAAIMLLTACDSNKFFEEYMPVPNGTWPKGEKSVFEVEISDPQQAYNLFIELRNKEDYHYRNLFLFLDIESPSGKINRDTLECMLADVKGKWYGDRAGDLVDNKVWFKKDHKFTEIGSYIFRFEQAMREDTLIGITDFGLRIETP